MCGLSGFVGIADRDTRESLALVLGDGIDTRGGHAAGYITLDGGKPRIGRKLGNWLSAKDAWLRRACDGHTTMMHARFATHGANTIANAHPFAIQRNSRSVLWGAHNGVIYDANDSAKLNNRPFSVDSRELFELLADNLVEDISKLSGYGVITWVEADTSDVVYLSRLTDSGDIHIVETTCGGLVWGSTERIVDEALDFAGLQEKHFFNVATGTVYAIRQDGLYATKRDKVTVQGSAWQFDMADYSSDRWMTTTQQDANDKRHDAYVDAWLKQREEDDKRDIEKGAYDRWMANEPRKPSQRLHELSDSELDAIIDRNMLE